MSEGTAKRPPRFGGQRIRSFAPKSRGGCATCKRRRVKCGEEKPSCQRCLQSKRHCEGYEEVPKSWSLDATTRAKPSESVTSSEDVSPNFSNHADSDDDDDEEDFQLIHRSNECENCGGAHIHSSCPKSMVPTLLRPSGSPYRSQNEQYLFKFFNEVCAATVSRSGISTYYWKGAFPQVAHDSSSVRDCLLAISAAFHAASGPIFAVNTVPSTTAAASFLTYEGRAMRALSRGKPSTIEVLNTSMAFWISSMVLGDWQLSLQHLYYCLKILKGLSPAELSRIDKGQVQYQTALATIGLRYFRTTRGACKIHGPGDFLDCEATCYTPEKMTFAQSVADAVHHLQAALPSFEMCQELLLNRIEPHSRQAEIAQTLQKEIREMRFLIKTWLDKTRMKIPDDEWTEAVAESPWTASPFEPILSDLIRLIVNDQYTTGIIWQELELRARVAIPHIVSATSRGNPILIEDSVALMYYSGYTEGSLRVKATFSHKHVAELLDPAYRTFLGLPR